MASAAFLLALAGSRMADAEGVIGFGANTGCDEWLIARSRSTTNPFCPVTRKTPKADT